MIATAGDPLGTGGSWLAGPDLTYQTSHFRGDKNFLAGVWGLAMGRQGIGGGTSAVGFKVDYPNDLWDIAFTGRRVDAGFQPSIGFVPRPGIYALNLNINFSPRPRRPLLGLRVRQMTHESLNSLVTDLSGRWESYRIFTAPINWRFESGDRFEFNANPTGERLAQPSEIAGVLVPAGGYHWVRYRLEAGFATKRRVSGQVTWWFGRFYSGNLHELILTVSIKPSATFIMDLNATRNSGRLPQGDISQTLVGARFRVNLSPDLQFNSYLQYDNDTRRVGSNSRLRWTFAPQGEAFVVYHHNINELQDPSGRHQDWQFASNQLLVKVQYAFRY